MTKTTESPAVSGVGSSDVLERLTVGEYTITPYGPFCRKGSFWIAHSSGKGMEISGEKFKDWVHTLFRIEF